MGYLNDYVSAKTLQSAKGDVAPTANKDPMPVPQPTQSNKPIGMSNLLPTPANTMQNVPPQISAPMPQLPFQLNSQDIYSRLNKRFGG